MEKQSVLETRINLYFFFNCSNSSFTSSYGLASIQDLFHRPINCSIFCSEQLIANSRQTLSKASFNESNFAAIIAFSILTTYSEKGRSICRICCTCFIGLQTPFSTKVPQKSNIIAFTTDPPL